MRKRDVWLAALLAALLLVMLGVTLAQGQAPAARLAPTSVARQPSNEIIHVVRWGETLGRIARRYGLGVWELAAYNSIRNPDLIYAGQILRIPQPPPIGPAPEPTRPPIVAPTPSALPCPCEEIIIVAPGQGVTVTNPVTVTGIAASPFEQTVVVRVLDGSGQPIGLTPGIVTGEYGQRGPFTVTVPFTVPLNSQPGRIQVFTESPRDGAMEHLSSVMVNLRGLDLDALLERLDTALTSKDYAALASMLAPQFRFGPYQSEWGEMSAAQALPWLRSNYLEPGRPRLDFSVDARQLLGDRATFPADVVHVVFSPGWGPDQNDDAFLLFGAVNDQARWTGLLYVYHDLIDYR